MPASSPDSAAEGHHGLFGQPHDEPAKGPVAQAEAAQISSSEQPMGSVT